MNAKIKVNTDSEMKRCAKVNSLLLKCQFQVTNKNLIKHFFQCKTLFHATCYFHDHQIMICDKKKPYPSANGKLVFDGGEDGFVHAQQRSHSHDEQSHEEQHAPKLSPWQSGQSYRIHDESEAGARLRHLYANLGRKEIIKPNSSAGGVAQFFKNR